MTGGNTCSRWQPLILVYEALLPSSRHGIALKPPINNGRRALDRGARRPRRRFPTKSVDSIVRTLCTEAPKALNVSRTPCVSGVCAGHEAGALTLCELPRARLAYRFNRASSSPRTFIPPKATGHRFSPEFSKVKERENQSTCICINVYE